MWFVLLLGGTLLLSAGITNAIGFEKTPTDKKRELGPVVAVTLVLFGIGSALMAFGLYLYNS